MRLRELPVIGYVLEAGADDRVFDSLLFVGPFVVGLVALIGRSLFTEALAIGYLAVFVAYTLYRWLHNHRFQSADGQ